MNFKPLLAFCLICFLSWASAAPVEKEVTLNTNTGTIFGTLLVPSARYSGPVALFIGGSGPTDRDGNVPGARSDMLRSLAAALAERGIASLRYDKRGIGASKSAGSNESDIRFGHYVTDAAKWLKQLREQNAFSRVVVVGHSEGSLIGMLASLEGSADAFISLAGLGDRGDVILARQLQGRLPPHLQRESDQILAELGAGKVVPDVSPELFVLYRSSVQPYLISWFKHDPKREFKSLRIPSTIIQGDSDLQAKVEDARLLFAANPSSKLVIIPGMNHVLKLATGSAEEQKNSYTMPGIPIAPALIDAVADAVLRPVSSKIN